MSDLAPMREQVYADPRPKEHFDRFHERARTREPDWAYELTRVLTSLYAYTFLRVRSISSEKAPGAGAVILAPNHFSFMDHFLMGCYIRRKVRFMAKSQLFKPARCSSSTPTAASSRCVAARATRRCSSPPRRSSRAAERSRCTARAGARAPAKWPSRPSAASAVWRSRPVRPVVPIAIHGSSRIRNWKRLQFPKTTVQYGDAMRWERIEQPTREQQQAVADEILLQIRALYAGLEEHGRKGVLSVCASSVGPSAARGSPCRSRASPPRCYALASGGILCPGSGHNGAGRSTWGCGERGMHGVGGPRTHVRPDVAAEAIVDELIIAAVAECGGLDLLVVDGAGLFMHGMADIGDARAALRDLPRRHLERDPRGRQPCLPGG